MKKKLYIGLSITIFLLISIIAYSSQIPRLEVSFKGEKIQLLKCPFSWDTLLTHKRWDYQAPNELAEKLNEAIVSPEAKIGYDFSKNPDNLHVTIWDEKAESYISEANEIEVPKEKGNYIFSVIGEWKQGQVLYLFKVRVE